MEQGIEVPGARALDGLIGALQPLQVAGTSRPVVQGIQHDSRLVRPGDVFVAIPGLTTDGAVHVEQALHNGAVAVVSDKGLHLGVPCIQVTNPRLSLAQAAAWFYGYPSRRLKLTGVTGTNGKTTTCYLIRSILDRMGGTTGLIGTIVNCLGAQQLPSRYTTPESPELQLLLAKMVAMGTDRAVMEVSSHALAQERVACCRFDTVIFTNLTHDHLDFHKSLDNYKGAKAKLFHVLVDDSSRRIINLDDEFGRELLARTGSVARTTTYGLTPEADLYADDIELGFDGTVFTLHVGQEERRLNLPLIGLFNVYNALAAAACGLSVGAEMDLIAEVLEGFPGIPGRLQRVDCGQPFTVFVDYAHTPDGLEQVLKALRPLAAGRLLTVFGCTGDRDTAKRPVMGEIAARWSDFVCITSDDPHTENPAGILGEIEQGVLSQGKRPGSDYLLEIDRSSAIEAALWMAAPGDIVLIAGKGHEAVQVFKDRVVEYSDERTARGVLAAIMTRKSAG
jgi:UDP-N-acetylmuramoyl-L-alanyl-D-glutamate--2,6-diaminopimelate ligase